MGIRIFSISSCHASWRLLYNPKDLKRFINAFKHCIGKVNWQVATRHIEHHKNTKKWEDAINDLSVKLFTKSSTNTRNGHGAVYLKIKHPDKEGHTSPLLSYMLRMAIIMLMTITLEILFCLKKKNMNINKMRQLTLLFASLPE